MTAPKNPGHRILTGLAATPIYVLAMGDTSAQIAIAAGPEVQIAQSLKNRRQEPGYILCGILNHSYSSRGFLCYNLYHP